MPWRVIADRATLHKFTNDNTYKNWTMFKNESE